MATFGRWQATIRDQFGNVVPTASVDVRNENDLTFATLFSDRLGTVSLANPFSSDSNGYAFFHSVGGAYKITTSKGSLSQILRYVAVGTDQEADI
jgi:hypothetical protein